MSVRATLIMVLTFALGIVPATLLVLWAVLLGAAGVAGLFAVGDPGVALRGLLAVAAAVLSLFGYVALFQAAGDAVTPKVARWLSGGIVADLIGIGFLMSEPEWWGGPGPSPSPSPGLLFVLFSPLVVGCAHLVRYLVGARQRAASV
jgi:hypothetical protein